MKRQPHIWFTGKPISNTSMDLCEYQGEAHIPVIVIHVPEVSKIIDKVNKHFPWGSVNDRDYDRMLKKELKAYTEQWIENHLK
jgi:hypothetical protein